MPKNEDKEIKMRQPAVAGQFYPANQDELLAMIDDFLVKAEPSQATIDLPQIIIVPHAGYIYSGSVAAFAFKALQARGYTRAIIIGRSHQRSFDNIAIDGNDVWQTPLGEVALDKEFITKLKKVNSDLLFENSAVHKTEHSLEVEVPFLQKVLGSEVKIVPLLFGDDDLETSEKLADALSDITDDKTIIVISSDLSHYPSYEDANTIDRRTIDAILSSDIKTFQETEARLMGMGLENLQTTACARPAVLSAMFLAKQMGLQVKLLKYTNSGDAMPANKEAVVGYGAIVFDISGELNIAEQKIALQIARQTLQAAFEKSDYQLSADLSAIFSQNRGVFITLKKGEQLRGCIGNFQPNIALGQNIKDMALSAGFDDSRFSPLEKSELKDIEIEISVLSPLQKITNPSMIIVGRHGVMVKKGSRGGVYLPQVATEMGWDKEEFLNSLCEHKAGLSKDSWRDGATDLYIFTAQVFSE